MIVCPTGHRRTPAGLLLFTALLCAPALGQTSAYLYGIHDHSPSPQEWLNRVDAGGAKSWVTATVAIGSNPANTGGDDFRWISNQGHAVIVRLNNGYCPTGTIPVPSQYANFAQRCANYVANTQGADIFVIGNETNLAVEWPPVNGHASYISPQSYAQCFRLVYDAIKAVRPNAQVLPQALAPWAGPYGAGSTCGFTHDAMPLNWVTYLNQMLTAIKNSGPGPDGIALHINSRGYTYNDIHSTNKINAGGQLLYFSFYVYKDWVDLGIPQDMWHLPLYATECNGNYFWKGGHAECTDMNNPSCSYQPGWMQEIYAEIDRYNQEAALVGKPIYRAVNMYRWCAHCDPWNIDNAPQKGQILADLDQAVAAGYQWPGGGPPPTCDAVSGTPTGENLSLDEAVNAQASSVFNGDVASWGPQKAIDGIVSAASKWVSANTAPPHWLALDLGGERTVDGFIVRLPGAAGELQAFNARVFTIQSGPSMAGPWTDEACVDNAAQSNVVQVVFPEPKKLRYVRLHITQPGDDNISRIPEFEVIGEPPGFIGDFDGDGFVDLNDYAFFQQCLSGNFNPYTHPACAAADLDGDGDVDINDFNLFLPCMNGPLPPPTACRE